MSSNHRPSPEARQADETRALFASEKDARTFARLHAVNSGHRTEIIFDPRYENQDPFHHRPWVVECW